jgi:hypothetical protein
MEEVKRYHIAPKEEKKALAIKRLLEGKSKEEIGSDLNITPLQMIRIEAELNERNQHKMLTHSYLSQRKEMLPKVLTCGLNLLANGLKHRMDMGEPLTLRECEIVSRIISNVDHIARLDAGDPTQIIDLNKTVPTTFKDIVAAFKKDPFIDTQLLIEEIDFNVSNVDKENDHGADKDNNEPGNKGTTAEDKPTTT